MYLAQVTPRARIRPVKVSHDAAQAVRAKAHLGPDLQFHHHAAGNCLSAFKLALLDSPSYTKVGMYVRCRKCTNCMKARASMWAARAFDDLQSSGYSAFIVTLTYPADPLAVGTPDEILQQRAAAVSRDLTLFLKRCRKDGLEFRYFAALEKQKSGNPHWHLFFTVPQHWEAVLLQERSNRHMAKLWGHGFVDVRRADGKGMFYVTKYIVKSPLHRIRASLNFGQQPPLSADSSQSDPVSKETGEKRPTKKTPPSLRTIGEQDARL